MLLSDHLFDNIDYVKEHIDEPLYVKIDERQTCIYILSHCSLPIYKLYKNKFKNEWIIEFIRKKITFANSDLMNYVLKELIMDDQDKLVLSYIESMLHTDKEDKYIETFNSLHIMHFEKINFFLNIPAVKCSDVLYNKHTHDIPKKMAINLIEQLLEKEDRFDNKLREAMGRYVIRRKFDEKLTKSVLRQIHQNDFQLDICLPIINDRIDIFKILVNTYSYEITKDVFNFVICQTNKWNFLEYLILIKAPIDYNKLMELDPNIWTFLFKHMDEKNAKYMVKYYRTHYNKFYKTCLKQILRQSCSQKFNDTKKSFIFLRR